MAQIKHDEEYYSYTGMDTDERWSQRQNQGIDIWVQAVYDI